MLDDQRPTLTLTLPRAGDNPSLTRILVGMHDYGSGLDMESFKVVADCAINGTARGQNLAPKFRYVTQGVWELRFTEPIILARGQITVSVRDRQGNETRIERTLSAGSSPSR